MLSLYNTLLSYGTIIDLLTSVNYAGEIISFENLIDVCIASVRAFVRKHLRVIQC